MAQKNIPLEQEIIEQTPREANVSHLQPCDLFSYFGGGSPKWVTKGTILKVKAKKNNQIQEITCVDDGFVICQKIENGEMFLTLDYEVVKRNLESLPWYDQMNPNKKSKTETTPIETEDESEGGLISTDPFIASPLLAWNVLYFADVVHYIYPPTTAIKTTEAGKKIVYLNRFHDRALFYRIISEPILIPLTQKTLGLPKKAEISDGLLTQLRYGRFIPIDQIYSARSTRGVQPPISGLTKIATPNKHSPEIEFKVELKPFELEIETPCIVLWTEKGELGLIFDELAEKYCISYYISGGQPSISDAYAIWEYIKANSKIGIVLMCHDYDNGGLVMSLAAFRKLQFFNTTCKDAPLIICKDFMLSQADHIELSENHVPKVKKKTHEIYELAALNFLINRKLTGNTTQNYTSLFDIWEKKLLALFPPSIIKTMPVEGKYISESPLIVKSELVSKLKEQTDLLKTSLNEQFKLIKSNKQILDGVLNFPKFEKAIYDDVAKIPNYDWDTLTQKTKEQMQQLPYFHLMQAIAKNSTFIPWDVFHQINPINVTSAIEHTPVKKLRENLKLLRTSYFNKDDLDKVSLKTHQPPIFIPHINALPHIDNPTRDRKIALFEKVEFQMRDLKKARDEWRDQLTFRTKEDLSAEAKARSLQEANETKAKEEQAAKRAERKKTTKKQKP